MATEFKRINDFFKPLAGKGAFDLADDTALLAPYAITTDTIVQGVHFMGDESPDSLAIKLLAVNLSDLASVGATPHSYTLNLTLPNNTDDSWFRTFAKGLKYIQDTYNISLIGGDCTHHNGNVVLSATIFGKAIDNPPLRCNAKLGDIVCLSGGLGAGAFGLLSAQGKIDDRDLLQHYQTPRPHINEGIAIAPYINACADISDGLLADAGHIADASSLAIEIYYDTIPIDSRVEPYFAYVDNAREMIATGGDDYVLLFTLDEKNIDIVKQKLNDFYIVGKVVSGKGIKLLDTDNKIVNIERLGYEHS